MTHPVKDLVLSPKGLGRCCHVGTIPGPGTSIFSSVGIEVNFYLSAATIFSIWTFFFLLVCMPEEGFKGELHLSCFVHECQSHTVIFY